MLASYELDPESTKRTTSSECPVRGVQLLLAHPTASLFRRRMDRTDLNSKSTKKPSGSMKPAPPPSEYNNDHGQEAAFCPVYDPEVAGHLNAIEQKYHSHIRGTIEEQLFF
jgi:hypothetical protein